MRWLAALTIITCVAAVLVIVRAGSAVVSGEEPRSSNPSMGASGTPRSVPSSPLNTALASSYGPGLYGNRMACGGWLWPQTRAVAHRWLPCGTRLRVCYDRSCVHASVRDRGPYISGRTLDLSEALVRALGYRSSMSWGVRVVVWRIR